MKKEIGSEFWDTPILDKENNLFPDNVQWYLSGRSALNAIVKNLGSCKSVALPSWCCESIIIPFIKAGIKVSFYSVIFDKTLIIQPDLNADVLLIMDFFGDTSINIDLSEYKGVVIRDVTHSLFSKKYLDADYYFGSLRKWCGVWTGGFAWSNVSKLTCLSGNDQGYVLMRKKAMQMKAEYITNDFDSNKDYLSVFEYAEELLRYSDVQPADEHDVFLAKHIDVDFLVNQRKKNSRVLIDAFSQWIMFSFNRDTDCPLFVPVLIPNKNRDGLRKYLIDNHIYCPIHWPLSEYNCLDSNVEKILNNELSLVCDQRYDEIDMFHIVETINSYMEKH